LQQIVDLQNDPEFQALNVAILSVARDSPDEQAPAAAELGISAPMLVDADSAVAEAYDVLQWALPGGEPSHTFILVNKDGTVAWIKDYGAPDNPNRTMYVEIAELVREISANLKS
jgi:peroxiredoxin